MLQKFSHYSGHGKFEVSNLKKKNNELSLHFPTLLDKASVRVADVVYIGEYPYMENRGEISFSDENV